MVQITETFEIIRTQRDQSHRDVPSFNSGSNRSYLHVLSVEEKEEKLSPLESRSCSLSAQGSDVLRKFNC